MTICNRAVSVRRPRRSWGVALAYWVPVALAVATSALVSSTLIRAHEGHDHDKPPPLNLPVAPRVVAVTPDYELVAVLSGKQRLTIFLNRFATGKPVANAKLSLSAGGASVDAHPNDVGVFEASAPWINSSTPIDIVFKLTLPDDQDILTGRLEPAQAARSSGRAPSASLSGRLPILYVAIGALMTGVLLTLLTSASLSRRRGAAVDGNKRAGVADAPEPKVQQLRKALVIPLLLATFLPPDGAEAQSNLNLPSVPATMATDIPQRMSDGSLFVPQATQHLLSVRTIMAEKSQARRTTQLIGTVIADPNGLARVQTGHAGRVEAPEDGLAFVGKRVAKGDLLARLRHHLEAYDRGTLQGDLAELQARISTQETKLGMYLKAPLAVPRIKIEEARGELQALRQKRQQLAPTLAETEEVLAPMSGVVSVANVVPGQVVDAREVMFEIVDPNHFWVEAIAHDSNVATNMAAAFAVTGRGEKLPLEFAGLGLTLKQQAAPLMFRLPPSTPNLSIGRPVTVMLQSATEVTGIVVPASSLLRAPSGLSMVWVKTQPERFEPRTVRYEPLDGERVTLLAGVEPEERVVTDGATLLNQIR